jgi:predicted nicotinamide N-methyase
MYLVGVIEIAAGGAVVGIASVRDGRRFVVAATVGMRSSVYGAARAGESSKLTSDVPSGVSRL